MADQDQDKKRREAEDRAQRDAMQGWIRSTFRDPEFRKLSGVQKIQVMEEADPEFKAIPTMADKARVVQSYMYQFPEGLPSTGSKALDFAQGFAGAALTPLYVGGDIIRRATGQERIINRPEIQYMMNPPESTAGKLGALAEPALELLAMPEMTPTKVPKLLKSGQALMREGVPVLRETLPSLARRSAFEGAKMGTQAELHGDKPAPGAILGASMPLVGAMVKGFVSPQVSGTARWLYNRALNPTKKITKGEAAEVVPELLQRKFWATTFPRLQANAEENLKNAEANLTKAEDQAVKDLENTYVPTGRYRTVRTPGAPPSRGPVIDVYGGEAAPPGTPQVGAGTQVGPRRPNVGPRVPPQAEGFGGSAASSSRIFETQKGAFSLQPVLDALRDVMRSAHVGGRFPTRQSEILYRTAREQYVRLRQFGRVVPLRDAIKIRRILDKPLGQKGAFYEMNPVWQSLDRVQQIAANKLRGLINDNFPQLAQANHEYHLWKTTTHIMNETERRKIGQVGLVHLLATAIPAGVHVAGGADVATALKGVILMNATAAVANSPGLQTMSGVAFQQLADALDSRNLERFLQAAGTVVRPKEDQGDDFDVLPPLTKRPGRSGPPGGPRTALAAPPAEGTQVTGSVVPAGQIPESEQQYRYTTREGIPVYGRTQPSPPEPDGGAAAVRTPGLTPQASRLIADAVTRIPGAQPELPRIMRVVAAQESAGQQTKDGTTLTSPKGAMGIMQLTQATADTYGVDPNDPADNIKGGGYFLRDLISKYGSDERGLANVFAAYYNGHVPTDWSKAPDTARYVQDMMARMGYRWSPPARPR